MWKWTAVKKHNICQKDANHLKFIEFFQFVRIFIFTEKYANCNSTSTLWLVSDVMNDQTNCGFLKNQNNLKHISFCSLLNFTIYKRKSSLNDYFMYSTSNTAFQHHLCIQKIFEKWIIHGIGKKCFVRILFLEQKWEKVEFVIWVEENIVQQPLLPKNFGKNLDGV